MKQRLFAAIFVLLPTFVLGAPRNEPLFLLFEKSVVKDASASFSIVFSKKPDFFILDSNGNQIQEFQYELFDSANSSITTMVIRGGEIHLQGSIPIRDATPPSSDPSSGGWGEIRWRAPYTQNGRFLFFSVPMEVLNFPSGFGYTLIILENGALTDSTQSEPSILGKSIFASGLN